MTTTPANIFTNEELQQMVKGLNTRRIQLRNRRMLAQNMIDREAAEKSLREIDSAINKVKALAS